MEPVQLRLRATYAFKEKHTCQQYYEGHMETLKAFHLENITSASTSWIDNPTVYMVLIEDPETGEVLGGARLQVSDGVTPLPGEIAMAPVEPRIKEEVANSRANGGVAEFCGLWISRKVGGKGLNPILMSAVLAVSSQLGIKYLYAIANNNIRYIGKQLGFTFPTHLGNNATFYYEQADSTAVIGFLDCTTLENAHPVIRREIFNLRDDPMRQMRRNSKNHVFDIDYQLKIDEKDIELVQSISQAEMLNHIDLEKKLSALS